MPLDEPRESPFPTSMRMPPSNVGAEQALLGALLTNNRAYERVGGFLRPEHFADSCHAAIYAAIERRVEAGQIANPVTLKAEFEHSGALDDAGGVGYLVELLGAMVSIISAPDYARAVHETWLRRQLIEAGEVLVNESFLAAPDRAPSDLIGSSMERLLALGDAGASDAPATLAEAVGTALAQSEAARTDAGCRGLDTGISALDRMWRGLWPGSLDILGARPEVGKTALGLQIATHVALRLRDAGAKEHVVFFSLEMPRADLGTRLLATQAAVSADDIRDGSYDMAAAERLVQAQRGAVGLPLVIDDRAGLTLPQIEMQARALKRRLKARLIVIDHLHRIRPVGKTDTLDHVATCTLRLKDLARRLELPVLLLAQLSRETERRDDPTPRMSDLRYAGEADADNIVFLHRSELYLRGEAPARGSESAERYSARLDEWHRKREDARGKALAIFAKRRQGALGTVEMRFDGPRTWFFDPAEEGRF